MDRWTCPKCRREFGRKGQSHACSPGLTVDEYFATAKPWERPIFNIVSSHVTGLGDVIVDPIGIGILFKNGPAFCQLRAKTKWTALGFSLSRKLTSERLSRKVIGSQSKYFHVINVNEAEQIDEVVLDWLTEAYHTAGGTLHLLERPDADSADPMAPDDIDDPFA